MQRQNDVSHTRRQPKCTRTARSAQSPSVQEARTLGQRSNEVWSWDITKLKGPEKWTYYYLYTIIDIYSRCTVGWMLAHRESVDKAEQLIQETIEKPQVKPEQLIIHCDRGPSMTSHSVAQSLATLGVTKTHSRPHVSNDNPFSESQYKTMKYRPDFPKRFGCYEDANAFFRRFFQWYNNEHCHSGFGLLTPGSLHYGLAPQIIDARKQTLEKAWLLTPQLLASEVTAWESNRNQQANAVNWQLTTDDARIKLRRLYPEFLRKDNNQKPALSTDIFN